MSELKTCFKRVDYDLSNLLNYIDIGDIGLPDIQRPFVWSNAKVRDLFDSMYRGFPVGYLLFWENAQGNGARQIGLEAKKHTVPARLIVDGQQRLTSLYAVFRGREILDADYRRRPIEIAFHPRDGKFEVADATIRRDPEWISNISDLWTSGHSSRKLVNDFIEQLSAKSPLTGDDTALEIAPTVDEEQVADIFVRINSERVKLNQADFNLTLLSVFWDKGRAALELLSRISRSASQGGCFPVQSLRSTRSRPAPPSCCLSRSGLDEAGLRASTKSLGARTLRLESFQLTVEIRNSSSCKTLRQKF